MNRKPIVWVAQEGVNDYSPAEEFGEVRFITRHDWVKMAGSRVNSWISEDIREFITQYVPGVDFVVMAGNPIVTSLIVSAMVYKHATSEHQYLKWDGRRGIYIPHSVGPLTVFESITIK